MSKIQKMSRFAAVLAGICRKCACRLVTVSFPVPPNALVMINLAFVNTVIDVKIKKVKQSRYRPGVAQRVPGS